MPEEWFDLAYVNDELILHGKRADRSVVRVELTHKQRESVEALENRQMREMQRLLRGMAEAA